MRLIDAEEMEKNGWTAERVVQVDSHTMEWQKKKPTDFSTIDAVPVIRCKDCRFYRFYDGTFGKGWMCFENNTARHGDDYCSRGERKDDG